MVYTLLEWYAGIRFTTQTIDNDKKIIPREKEIFVDFSDMKEGLIYKN